MYLKQSKTKNGRIYLSITDSYYDKATQNAKHITIESLGYLDDLQKQYDDPITHFQKRVDQLKEEKKPARLPSTLPSTILTGFVPPILLYGKTLATLHSARSTMNSK